MAQIVYKNFHGEQIVKNLDTFDIRCTITNIKQIFVDRFVCCRMCVNVDNEKKNATIWENAKGFNLDKLKVGATLRFKGFIQRNGYCGADGLPKTFCEYKIKEMYD